MSCPSHCTATCRLHGGPHAGISSCTCRLHCRATLPKLRQGERRTHANRSIFRARSWVLVCKHLEINLASWKVQAGCLASAKWKLVCGEIGRIIVIASFFPARQGSKIQVKIFRLHGCFFSWGQAMMSYVGAWSSPQWPTSFWDALPLRRLRQREFFTFGMDVLLKLDLNETRQFFSAFFNLSEFYWQVQHRPSCTRGELLS